jgi:hypothetical protein
MSKRVSGPPRRPRNPVAKQVRTPRFRMRVEVDRKRRPDLPRRRQIETQLVENADSDASAVDDETDAETGSRGGAGV